MAIIIEVECTITEATVVAMEEVVINSTTGVKVKVHINKTRMFRDKQWVNSNNIAITNQ